MGCHRPFSFSPLCLTYRRKNRKPRSDFASAAVATPPISKEIKEIVPVKILVDIGKIEHRVVFFSGNCGPEVSHLGWRKWYTIRELEAATNGLCEEKVIGEGCYGIVYRGFLTDGTKVAVKNLLNNRYCKSSFSF